PDPRRSPAPGLRPLTPTPRGLRGRDGLPPPGCRRPVGLRGADCHRLPRRGASPARLAGRHRGALGLDGDPLERRLYVLRRVIERRSDAVGLTRDRFHLASLSSRTLVYKGMLTADQLPAFYPDLRDPITVSRLAMVHARFSTNVLPRWDLAP